MGDEEYIIDRDYLENMFPDISEYGSNVIRNYLYEAIYGISCGLDKETGQAIISNEEKEKVKVLYNKYVDYLKKTKSEKRFESLIKNISLCFHLAISGDYETCHKTIVPDEDWDEAESEYESQEEESQEEESQEEESQEEESQEEESQEDILFRQEEESD